MHRMLVETAGDIQRHARPNRPGLTLRSAEAVPARIGGDARLQDAEVEHENANAGLSQRP